MLDKYIPKCYTIIRKREEQNLKSKGEWIMFKVINKKGKEIMSAKSKESAIAGLRAGSYKSGEYSIVAPDGKTTLFVKY